MEFILLLYLGDIITGVSIVALIVSGILGVFLLFTVLYLVSNFDDEKFNNRAEVIRLKKVSKPLLIVFSLTLIFTLALPSKTFIYTVTGLYVGKSIIDNPKTNNILDKTYNLINSQLDKYFEELNPKEKENK